MPAQWEEIGRQKRQERDSKIPDQWRLQNIDKSRTDVISVPRECGLLTDRELDITENYDAKGIVDAIARQRWTAEEVTIAFCKRAAIAQQLVNCLTEIFFDPAIDRARYLDNYLQEHGKPIGPLHGLPISVKDSFSIPGFPSSVGLASRALTPDTAYATMPALLLSAGAILYVKTTTPQAQMCFDTNSALWGRTLCPHKTTLTAGGSSGGEAALIAMKGSVLGIGSDLGGSVRIPAFCCKLFGVKPTSYRTPRLGTETIEMPGANAVHIPVCVGPLARTAGDCKWFFEVLASLQPWRFDSQVLPYTFSSPFERDAKLKIGLLSNNGITAPLPPVAAVLDEVRSTLVAAGHTVELITLPEFAPAFTTTAGFLTLTGTNGFFDALESVGGEPLSPWLATRTKRVNMRPNALVEFCKLSHQKQQAEMTFIKRLWERGQGKDRLDVVMCPVAGHPTPKHDDWVAIDWLSVWNMLDYPAAVSAIGH
ncbi:amidase signature enzyme [Wilcoxina mikolae CBS 423.85]|nr:amidase signature enzyme [Wilcoxina mikolae CBS 423.85]